MNPLLIVGDPSGLHSLTAMKRGWKPENIWVWENDPTHFYTIKQQHAKINLVEDFGELKYMNKRFISIGNPPFSDRSKTNSSKSPDLDSLFVLECMEISCYIKMIIRSKHFTNPKSNFRKKLFSSGHVKSIIRVDDSAFPIQNTETCILEWDETYTGPTKIKYKNGEIFEKYLDKDTVIKLDNPDFVAEVENNLAHRWVRGKLNRNKIVPGNSPMVEVCGTGETPVIQNIEPGLEETARNVHGVVINVAADWGSLGKVMIKPYEASISSSVMCLKTDSEEESIQLRDYLLSDKISEIVKLNMPSFHPTKDLFKKIKDPFK